MAGAWCEAFFDDYVAIWSGYVGPEQTELDASGLWTRVPGAAPPSASAGDEGTARRRLLPEGVEQIAESHPALAIEAGQLLLLDGGEVGRARVDLDAGQEER